jgi:hypothetical protein
MVMAAKSRSETILHSSRKKKLEHRRLSVAGKILGRCLKIGTTKTCHHLESAAEVTYSMDPHRHLQTVQKVVALIEEEAHHHRELRLLPPLKLTGELCW